MTEPRQRRKTPLSCGAYSCLILLARVLTWRSTGYVYRTAEGSPKDRLGAESIAGIDLLECTT